MGRRIYTHSTYFGVGVVVVRFDAGTEGLVGGVVGALAERGEPRVVDHHDERYAQVDAHRVAVDRRHHAHHRQNQPARRKLCRSPHTAVLSRQSLTHCGDRPT